MDQVGGIQSSAVVLPTIAGTAPDLGGHRHLVYRVLVPASPVILALCFGLYVPAVLSLENIINIIQQTAFLFVLTCAQTIVLLTRGLDLSLGPSVSMISVASALTMTAVVGSDGCQWHHCGPGRNGGRSFARASRRAVQRRRRGMAARQSVRYHTRQHEHLLGHRHIAFRRSPGIRDT